MTPEYLSNLQSVHNQPWGWTVLWLSATLLLSFVAFTALRRLVARFDQGPPDVGDFIYIAVGLSSGAATVPFFLMVFFKLHAYWIFGG